MANMGMVTIKSFGLQRHYYSSFSRIDLDAPENLSFPPEQTMLVDMGEHEIHTSADTWEFRHTNESLKSKNTTIAKITGKSKTIREELDKVNKDFRGKSIKIHATKLLFGDKEFYVPIKHSELIDAFNCARAGYAIEITVSRDDLTTKVEAKALKAMKSPVTVPLKSRVSI